jgi:CMP-N-acetylneuraminic acid synthetase
VGAAVEVNSETDFVARNDRFQAFVARLAELALAGDGTLALYDPAGAQVVARQQLAAVYHRNGIAYAMTRSCLTEQKTIMGRRTAGLVIEGPVANVDTELDLEWAEFLLAREGRQIGA